MIYTEYGSSPTREYLKVCKTNNIYPLAEWNSNLDKTTFYYDRHDRAIRRVEFRDLMTKEVCEYFLNNEDSYVYINYADDYINSVDLDRFASDIKLRNIDNPRIIFFLMDQNFEDFLLDGLKKRGVFNCSAININILLHKVEPRSNKIPPSTHRFSVFSRNYYPWRLSIFLELINRGVIDNTIYSFHNYNPYGAQKEHSLDKLKKDVLEEGYELTDNIENWINKVPYDLGLKSYKWAPPTFQAIDKSDIHIIIESHFDPYLGYIYDNAKPKYDPLTIAPGFLTEKTWKPIACKKPFILVATPYALRDLRKLGYRTFDNIIDETYDTIIDDKLRMKAVGAEVERLNNLSKEDFAELLYKLKDIVEFNYNLFLQQHKTTEDLKRRYPITKDPVVTS